MKINKISIAGFTLIELLVVISIISLLTSVVMSSLNNARAKARDARRMADIQEINKAIQLYINDNGHAPYLDEDSCDPDVDAGANEVAPCVAYNEGLSYGPSARWSQLETDLAPYFKKLPADPCGVACNGHDQNTGLSKWAIYQYFSPNALLSICRLNSNNTCSGNPQQNYIIFAQRLETKNGGYSQGAGFSSI